MIYYISGKEDGNSGFGGSNFKPGNENQYGNTFTYPTNILAHYWRYIIYVKNQNLGFFSDKIDKVERFSCIYIGHERFTIV